MQLLKVSLVLNWVRVCDIIDQILYCDVINHDVSVVFSPISILSSISTMRIPGIATVI